MVPSYESIRWQNGIASHDSLVPLENAQFNIDDIPPCLDFEQQSFECIHMEWPKAQVLFKKLFRQKIYPAIHNHPPVAKWILNSLFFKEEEIEWDESTAI